MSGLTLIPTHLKQQGTAQVADDGILESHDHLSTCVTFLAESYDSSSFAWESFIRTKKTFRDAISCLWEAWFQEHRLLSESEFLLDRWTFWNNATAVHADSATEERIRYLPVAEDVAVKAQQIISRLGLEAKFSPLTTHTVPENGQPVTFTVMETIIPLTSYSKEAVVRVYEALGEGLSEDEDKALSIWVIPGE